MRRMTPTMFYITLVVVALFGVAVGLALPRKPMDHMFVVLIVVLSMLIASIFTSWRWSKEIDALKVAHTNAKAMLIEKHKMSEEKLSAQVEALIIKMDTLSVQLAKLQKEKALYVRRYVEEKYTVESLLLRVQQLEQKISEEPPEEPTIQDAIDAQVRASKLYLEVAP